MTSRRVWRWSLFLAGLVLLSQAFSYPSPVRDAATFAWVPGYRLVYPIGYWVLAPYSVLADQLTLFSLFQLKILLVWFIAAAVLLGWRRGLFAVTGVVLFAAWTMLVPRPMSRLVSEHPDTLLIDFHSHTNRSHDGRRHFSAKANMEWHEAQGFDAGFITDHNRTEAAAEAEQASEAHWPSRPYRALGGEEISLWRTHLVVLGNPTRIDNQPFDSDPKKVTLFVREMKRQGFPVIASLPEYWRHHWGPGLDRLVASGISGFEIVNSAPKALDFPVALRHRIVRLCRDHNLFMTGVSDSHGYGSHTAVFNAMRLPGWRALRPAALETAVIRHLESERFRAVQVLERPRARADTLLGALLGPVASVWIAWRSLDGLLAVSIAGWILLLGAAGHWLCRRRKIVI